MSIAINQFFLHRFRFANTTQDGKEQAILIFGTNFPKRRTIQMNVIIAFIIFELVWASSLS